jgi:hypothetical protein
MHGHLGPAPRIKAQPKALHGEIGVEALRAEQEGYVARSVVGIEILEYRAPVRWQRDLDPGADRPAKARLQKKGVLVSGSALPPTGVPASCVRVNSL